MELSNGNRTVEEKAALTSVVATPRHLRSKKYIVGGTVEPSQPGDGLRQRRGVSDSIPSAAPMTRFDL
jgi:hypothetical protein